MNQLAPQPSPSLKKKHKKLITEIIVVVVVVTQPLPRDGGTEELHRDPTARPHPKVWSLDHRSKIESCRLIVVVQSPPQWGWVEMAGQISGGARPKGRLHCLEIIVIMVIIGSQKSFCTHPESF